MVHVLEWCMAVWPVRGKEEPRFLQTEQLEA